VEFDFRQAVADELQDGFHGIREKIKSGLAIRGARRRRSVYCVRRGGG
jgi:hypothetical protein